MDTLTDLITTLSPEEIEIFRRELDPINRQTLELKLFNAMLANADASNKDLSYCLYGAFKKEAYFGVRKRLNQKASEFIHALETEKDKTKAALVRSYLTLADRLLRFNKPSGAAQFLKKARTITIEKKNKELLDQILFTEVKNIEKFKSDADETILQWEENELKLRSKRRYEIVHARLRHELNKAKRAGVILDAAAITDSLYKEFKLTPEEAADPEIMRQLTSAARSAILSVKDYSKIEPFILRIYTRLEKRAAFTDNHISCQIEFLFMLVHAMYRNLKFAECKKWLAVMERQMDAHPTLSLLHQHRFISLKAEIEAYTGNNSAAIELLESTLKEKFAQEDESEYLNMKLNLAVCYFNADRWREANSILIQLPNDKALHVLTKGKEWILKKNMIQMIVQYELGHDDIAQSMLKLMQKNYNTMLRQPLYTLTGHFLKFTGRMVANRDVVDSPAFHQEVNAARRSWPKGKEDIHAISFFCWLKCKMLGRKYYEVLIERVNRIQPKKK
jgi:hypothetical protein